MRGLLMRRCIAGLSAVMALMLYISPAQAASGRKAGDQFKMNINISGTVVATGSCTFNDGSGYDLGKPLVWKNVTYSTTNGFRLIGDYRIAIDGEMTCTGDTAGNAKMTFTDYKGAGLDFNGHKVLSVIDSEELNYLGIELLVNGVPQSVGTAFSVDLDSPPLLEARLVQVANASEVEFRDGDLLLAEAVLTMEFE